jgi:hypothetical protein
MSTWISSKQTAEEVVAALLAAIHDCTKLADIADLLDQNLAREPRPTKKRKS